MSNSNYPLMRNLLDKDNALINDCIIVRGIVYPLPKLHTDFGGKVFLKMKQGKIVKIAITEEYEAVVKHIKFL